MGLPRFGWAWDPKLREWSQDVPLIELFYARWNAGTPVAEMAREFKLPPGSVRRAIGSTVQRRVVGDDAWLLAQRRPKGIRFAARADAGWGNVFLSMLRCPFCGATMQHVPPHAPRAFYSYYCKAKRFNGITHDWTYLSTRMYVVPAIQRVLAELWVPDEDLAYGEAFLAGPQPTRPRDFGGEIDRLTMAWVRGNLTQDR
jgi:hypothetical protein